MYEEMEYYLVCIKSVFSDKKSHSQMFLKIGVDKYFSKPSGKDLCRCLFFNKFSIHFIKKRLRDRYFLANFEKFLKTVLFIEHLLWLLLFSSALQITTYFI